MRKVRQFGKNKRKKERHEQIRHMATQLYVILRAACTKEGVQKDVMSRYYIDYLYYVILDVIMQIWVKSVVVTGKKMSCIFLSSLYSKRKRSVIILHDFIMPNLLRKQLRSLQQENMQTATQLNLEMCSISKNINKTHKINALELDLLLWLLSTLNYYMFSLGRCVCSVECPSSGKY